jgi:hypothetical protein
MRAPTSNLGEHGASDQGMVGVGERARARAFGRARERHLSACGLAIYIE